MSFSLYCKQAVWDLLLVALAAISLDYVVLFAFKMSADLIDSAIPAVLSAVLLVMLFGISYNKRSLSVGIPVYIVVCIGVLAACIGMSGDVFFLSDEPGNWFIGGLAVVLVTTLVFLLSRRLGGCAVLFAAGAFACAWVQFFYQGYLVVQAVVFLCAALALVVYKNFQLSVRRATSVRGVSFGVGFGTSLAVVAVAVGVGALVWYGVIAPLNPQAVQIKLITEYRSLETQKVIGVSDVYQTPNIDLTSNDTINDERTTDQLIIDENGRVMLSAPEDAIAVAEEELQGTMANQTGLNIDSLQQVFDVQNYTQNDWNRLLLLLLVPLIAALAYFIGRRVVRNKRLARIQRLQPSEQIESLYRFLMSRFSRIGLALPDGLTLTEYAASNTVHMEPFTTEAGDDFVTLSQVYSSVKYGAEQATQEQADAFARFYKNFWRAARKRLGNVRYFFKSFRL